MADLERIKEAVIKGKRKDIPDMIREALDDKTDPHVIINDYLIEALKVVGEKFEKKKIFVPEMMIAARAMQAGLDVIRPILETQENGGSTKLGTIVIGTVFGDLHDIGKNLVVLMLESSGFEVHDIGENVPPEKFVEKATEFNADIVGLSSLLTTGDPYVKATLEAFGKSVLKGKVKIICGGAAITEKFAVEECGADGHALDAVAAVALTKKLLGVT